MMSTTVVLFGVAASSALVVVAVLAGVAVEVLPDAYEKSGPVVAMATAVGFTVTFLIE